MSAPEPGPSERMNLTGRCGQLCAKAEVAVKNAIVQKTSVQKTRRVVTFMMSTILPRASDDGNKQSRNCRFGEDGRADGAPPSYQGLQGRRLRPARTGAAKRAYARRNGARIPARS